jgi:hypothetical protein
MTPQINNQNNTQNTEQDEFANNLVLVMTGNPITDYEDVYQPTLIQECYEAYTTFITDYVEAKYSLTDSTRLRSSLKYGDDVFAKFPDLEPKFDEAYSAFITTLEKQQAQIA